MRETRNSSDKYELVGEEFYVLKIEKEIRIPFGKSRGWKQLGGLLLLFALFLTKKDSSELFAPSKIKRFLRSLEETEPWIGPQIRVGFIRERNLWKGIELIQAYLAHYADHIISVIIALYLLFQANAFCFKEYSKG